MGALVNVEAYLMTFGNGILENQGTMIFGSRAGLYINSTSPFINRGTPRILGPTTRQDDSSPPNESQSLPPVTNAGIFEIGVGRTFYIGNDAGGVRYIQPSGETIVDGYLSLSSHIGSGVARFTGGSLKGRGTVNAAVVYAQPATISPGSPYGPLTLNAYLIMFGGSVDIEVRYPSGYDRLEVDQLCAYANSQVNVLWRGVEYPQKGTFFDVLKIKNWYCDFSAVSLPKLSYGYSWKQETIWDGSYWVLRLTII